MINIPNDTATKIIMIFTFVMVQLLVFSTLASIFTQHSFYYGVKSMIICDNLLLLSAISFIYYVLKEEITLDSISKNMSKVIISGLFISLSCLFVFVF